MNAIAAASIARARIATGPTRVTDDAPVLAPLTWQQAQTALLMTWLNFAARVARCQPAPDGYRWPSHQELNRVFIRNPSLAARQGLAMRLVRKEGAGRELDTVLELTVRFHPKLRTHMDPMGRLIRPAVGASLNRVLVTARVTPRFAQSDVEAQSWSVGLDHQSDADLARLCAQSVNEGLTRLSRIPA